MNNQPVDKHLEALLRGDTFTKGSRQSALWRDACIQMDDSLNAIKTHWKPYFFFHIAFYTLASIAWFVLFLVLSIVTAILVMNITADGSWDGGFGTLYTLFSLIALLVHGFYESVRFGIGYLAVRLEAGASVKAIDALRMTFKHLFRIFLITLVSDLPLLLLAGLLGALAMSSLGTAFLSALGGFLDALSQEPIQLVYLLLGFALFSLLLLLAHEVYRVFWSYSLYFYTLRDASLTTAIGYSFNMVREHFKRLFIARLSINLTMWLLGTILTWVVSGLVIALSFASMGLFGEWIVLIQQPLSLLNLALGLVAFLFTTGLAFHAQMMLFQRYAPSPASDVFTVAKPEVTHGQ